MRTSIESLLAAPRRFALALVVVAACAGAAAAADNAPPSVPVPHNPSDQSGATTTTPVFSWQASTDPEGEPVTYDLEVRDGADVIVDRVTGVGGTVTSVAVELENRATYAWHVRATDARGAASEYCPWATFTVNVPTGEPCVCIDGPCACDGDGEGCEAGCQASDAPGGVLLVLLAATLLVRRPHRRRGARTLLGLAVGLAAASAPTGARADALLVAGADRELPASIDVDVAVRAQVESTTYVFTFAPRAGRTTASLTVPAPAGATPVGVDVDRGGGFLPVPVEAQAPAAPAGGSGEPALVDWSGDAPLVAELEDLGPGALTVRVRFVRLLRRAGGEVAFDVGVRRCPARGAYDPPPQIRMRVRVATDRELTAFDATGGTGTVATHAARAGTITTAPTTLGLDEIVHVRYRERSDGIHAQLVAHRTPTADPMGGTAGYFLLLVDADEVAAGVPRRIGMIIDHSGSMAGDKIAQAREAARMMLGRLDGDDRFALHAFDESVTPFHVDPVAASAEELTAAAAWIDRLDADGGTDLDAGLQAGLGAPSSDGRFDAVILLSDGMATTGVVDDREILRRATARAAERTRIYTVSVGTDADFVLMEALARHNRGRHLDLNDAQAAHQLADRVRELLEDIHHVRLTDLELTVAGIGAADTLPEAPPDLFAGGQVVIVGRYAQPGTAAVTVRGREGAAPFVQTMTFDAPALAPDDDIIRFVWASEQVRALMASLAEGADPAAVRDQVTAIGLAYRIQTPYTRYAGAPVDDPAVYLGEEGCSAGGGATAGPFALALVLVLALLRGVRRRPARPR